MSPQPSPNDPPGSMHPCMVTILTVGKDVEKLCRMNQLCSGIKGCIEGEFEVHAI